MYRTRIQTFLQRENELKENNIKLRKTISDVENSAHDTVAVSLRRFDQYKVSYKYSFSVLKNKSFQENYFTCGNQTN